jgi:formamidopyrimidine-DNA glycosylase
MIESTYRLYDTASMLSEELIGSVVREVYMPGWYLDRWQKTQKKKRYFNKPADLVGFTFASIDPYGKSLVFRFENLDRLGVEDRKRKTRFLACDLGHGVWKIRKNKIHVLDAKNNSIIFICQKYDFIYQLVFCDKRRLGIFEIKDHFHELDILKHYGPPIASPHFSLEWMSFCIRYKSKRTIKSFVIDQGICAGITNRMASDILFFANIHPEKNPKELREDQIDRLFFSILVIYATYSKEHDYYNYSIYGRLNCPVCKSSVEKIKLRWRITYFCPKCQAKDYLLPRPITVEYVENILKITENMPNIYNGVFEYARRSSRLLSEGKKD